MSKEIEKREQKIPKTIQVKTVVIATTWFVSLVVAFLTGWFGNIEYQYGVQTEAAQMADKFSKVQSR